MKIYTTNWREGGGRGLSSYTAGLSVGEKGLRIVGKGDRKTTDGTRDRV